MTTALLSKEVPPAAQEPRPHAWCDLLLHWADRWRRWLLSGLVLVYLLGLNGQWRIDPDSALYLSIARNIADGRGYTYHDKPNASAYPGLPYLLSILFRVTSGPDRDRQVLILADLLMPALALGALAMTYRAVRLNSGRPTAVVVTCGLGLMRTFYRSAFAVMTDMPFLLGIMMFLAGYEGMAHRSAKGSRLHWLDALLMAGGLALAICMRAAWLAFVPVAVVVLAISAIRGRLNWKAAAAGVAVAGLLVACFYAADPRQNAGTLKGDRYEDQVLNQFNPDQRASAPARWLANGLDIFRETATSAMVGIKFSPAPDAPGPRYWYDDLGTSVNIIGGAATLVLGIALVRRRALWGLWIAATVVMMIVVLPHERYFLEALPLLVLGWWNGLRWLNHRLPQPIGNLIFFSLAGMGFVPNFLQVHRLIVEQRTAPFLAHYHGGTYQQLAVAARRIEMANLPANCIILAPEKTARILSFYSHHNVIESNEQGDDLRPGADWPPPHGRRVYVLADPADRAFNDWLGSLGVRATISLGGPPGRLELRRVPRPQLVAHYQQINDRAAAQ